MRSEYYYRDECIFKSYDYPIPERRDKFVCDGVRYIISNKEWIVDKPFGLYVVIYLEKIDE